MAEYINMITVSSVAATLFFGGWTLGALDGVLGAPFVWYAIKVAFFLFIFIWLRATLPRIRYDQLMRFGWQVLLPLAVVNALFTALVIALAWPWWASGLFGLAVIVLGTAIYYSRQRRQRRKGVKVVDESGRLLPDSVRLVRVESTPTPSDEQAPASEQEQPINASTPRS
jgi:NADH-quinone oxidoreductase subunit H